ncbi:hypothetical protein C4797_11965 [Salmonella enterica subsp. enterica serovar Weslaco]|nr:hypothetical protein C4797_11965 [Salmonella enterica subsp. enterica serovar Weslaco]
MEALEDDFAANGRPSIVMMPLEAPLFVSTTENEAIIIFPFLVNLPEEVYEIPDGDPPILNKGVHVSVKYTISGAVCTPPPAGAV